MTELTGDGSWPSVDLFNAISAQAELAAGVDVAKRVVVKDLHQCGITDSVLIIKSDGSHEIIKKNTPKRFHSLLSCRDVIKFVKSGILAKPIVWISRERIIVTDDSDRLTADAASYLLTNTELFDTIESLDNGDGYTQAEFLAILRVKLARAFVRDDDRLGLIAKVRSIIKREASMIGKGSGSYEVGTVDKNNVAVEWEDSLLLATPVYDDPDFATATYPVEVILDNRPEGRTPFILSPVSADLVKAQQESLKAMQQYIIEEVGDTNVFLGSP